MRIRVLVSRFVADEEGASAMEYGLITTLIAVAIILSAGLVGTRLTAVFDYLNTTMVLPAP